MPRRRFRSIRWNSARICRFSIRSYTATNGWCTSITPASHAVGVNAYIDIEVATFLAGFLLEHYPALLAARYGFATAGIDAIAVIEAIARKRGCIIKGRGGELDLEKAAAILLVDYRNGALGRISLETPGLRAARASALQQPVAVDPEKE